jgi:hypothetical protein
VQVAAVDQKSATGEQKFIRDWNPDDAKYQQSENGEIAIGRDPLEDGVFQQTMIASLEGPSMRRAAIGIRPHSGWAAAIVVAGMPGALEVVDRRKIAITSPAVRGSSQPYHFAKDLDLPDAELYLARCAASAEELALEGLREMISEATQSENKVESCALLLAAGRPLPELEKILAVHALIHTAEGEFFRQSFRDAARRLKLPVVGVRERDLEASAGARFGVRAEGLRREIAGLGKTLGPPWTADQKNACLAALLALA